MRLDSHWIHSASLHTSTVLFGLKLACELCTIPPKPQKRTNLWAIGPFSLGNSIFSRLQDCKMFQDLGQEIRVEQSSTSLQQKQVLTCSHTSCARKNTNKARYMSLEHANHVYSTSCAFRSENIPKFDSLVTCIGTLCHLHLGPILQLL